MIRKLMLGAAVVGMASLGVAEGPPAPPRPAPELESLAWFLGSWSCAGTVSIAGMGEQKVEARYTLEKDLGGFWYAGRFEGLPNPQSPMPPHVTRDYWTYSAASKAFVRINLDNLGDMARTSAPALADGRLAWVGTTTFGPREVPFHETFIKAGERELRIEGGVPGPQGKPAVDIHYTCRK